MTINCKVIWFDPLKQRKQCTDIGPNYAMFVAKKKVAEGMQDVVIKVTGKTGEDGSDAELNPIDADVSEAK